MDVNQALHDLQSALMPLNRIAFGKACFSPHVPKDVRKAWVDHGGTTCTLKQATTEEHIRFFCYGRTDPWYGYLSQNAIAIFHALWVLKVIEANFMLPIAPFVLNSDPVTPSSSPCSISCASPTQIPQSKPNQSSPVTKGKMPSSLLSSPHLVRKDFKHTLAEFQDNQHDVLREGRTLVYQSSPPRSVQQRDETPPRQITITPRSPPLVSSYPSKHTYESHFNLSRTAKKPRISVMPEPQEDSNILHSQLSLLSFPTAVRTDKDRPPRSQSSPKIISPDSSGDTLVSVNNIPHIDFREIAQKKRKSSPRSRATRSKHGLKTRKRKEILPLPFKPADKYHDTPHITLSAARIALRDVQVSKAAVILPRRVHLGKAFQFPSVK
ncbi:hypothetical protein BDY19DRAFT_930462 [Irpex rosettiformis]|uniref:Uncharacterized protein n=1 Tax=Irpex rosettiformis TaxID=378272 RepID=A0ACB8UB06_9APHY|nr:hypothetical protein BDY19DRAFT_930462 [Irpex rosettiformis]